jgi:predicted RNA-binding protein YlxR (DUF448 family)
MQPNYRRCISCRKIAAKQEFWRIVRLYDSQVVVLDQGMGRSAYLCPQAACLKQAERKDRLGKALKVPIPKAIYAQLWQRLQEQPRNGVLQRNE